MNTAIELDHLSVTIDGRGVLNDISCDVVFGEILGVIGSNGAGKTTLLRTILGLIRPSAGTVSVLGEPIRRGNQHIGYVAQRSNVDPDLPLQACDFVALGLDGERWGFALPSKRRTERIREALESVGMAGYAKAPIGKLSGGEQQRLFIAQALLSQPKLLLLDEPLSNLDLRSATEIVSLVDEIRSVRGVAVLFVTHDVNPLLQVMNRVVYLAAGRAVTGTVEQVVREDVLSALYGYHVDVFRAAGRVVVLAGEQDDHRLSAVH